MRRRDRERAERHQRAVCASKVNYPDEDAARRVAGYYRGQEPYRCPWCGFVHLATVRRAPRKRRRR